MPQSNSNKQGREGVDLISLIDKLEVQDHFQHTHEETFWLYQVLLQNGNVDNGGAFPSNYFVKDDDKDGEEIQIFVDDEVRFPGVAKELARAILPLNTYTEWYWSINLHNMFHFLCLRMDPHTQYETRVYANAMYELISPLFPIACEAFEDYILHSQTFSRLEMDMIKKVYNQGQIKLAVDLELEKSGLGKREMKEFKAKLGLGDCV